MTDTTISPSSSQQQWLMKGYDEKGNEIPYGLELALGAGGLKSAVADLLKYAQWQMEETDPAVKISHQPTFSYNNYSVGLNWQMVNAGGYRRIWQEGDRPGFTSICMVIPELKIGIVVLANEEDQQSSHALTLMPNRIAKELDARSSPLF
jgi:CubicO group peptidase (beta-lactamase class C family)